MPPSTATEHFTLVKRAAAPLATLPPTTRPTVGTEHLSGVSAALLHPPGRGVGRLDPRAGRAQAQGYGRRPALPGPGFHLPKASATLQLDPELWAADLNL